MMLCPKQLTLFQIQRRVPVSSIIILSQTMRRKMTARMSMRRMKMIIESMKYLMWIGIVKLMKQEEVNG